MTLTRKAEYEQSGPVPSVGQLRRGDRVRVRSAEAIAETLDEHGDTDKLPFMPEMLPMCGKTFEVYARADKTCDTFNMVGCTRAMSDTVHLVAARCDGSAHGGCKAACLLFFKESWLEKTSDADLATSDEQSEPETVSMLERNTQAGPEQFRCQSTQLLEASRPLDDSTDTHWINDLRTRNVPLRTMAEGFGWALVNKYQRSSQALPERLRVASGRKLPVLGGSGKKTPTMRLDLRPGELVEVKSRDEIMETLDERQRNRGLSFDIEMLRYCGRQARVLHRIDRLIDEPTGRMMQLKSDCVVLEDFICVGTMHKLCPRSIYAYWREIWLRRVEEPAPRSETDTGGM